MEKSLKDIVTEKVNIFWHAVSYDEKLVKARKIYWHRLCLYLQRHKERQLLPMVREVIVKLEEM